jgi:hypothetical protein
MRLSYDEFIARAMEVQKLDSGLGAQFRQLYVERGTLQQLVRMILDMRSDLKEALVNTRLLSEENIRLALGIQGQVSGIDIILDLILTQMNAEENDDEV